MSKRLKTLLWCLPVIVLLVFIGRRAFAEDQIPGTPYVMKQQGIFTLKFTPKEKTLEFYATGKPLVRLRPNQLTVVARESSMADSSAIKLNTAGDRFILPDAFAGKTIELKVLNTDKKAEKFTLEILPKD